MKQEAGPIVKTVNWQIDGMQCRACARTIEGRLVREPGVRLAEVMYPSGEVRLLLDDASVRLEPMIALLQQAGYRVKAQAARETRE
jgi:copper chaperone CopZ